ncbi:IclR family transcriptional regulator [Nocardia macrotermitis]|uniref:IclR family transcriptional regulator n=1 Tax=Nocardia macrotermitis TaxID=2585198 RepID=A0A7K0D788_9NOCA|nr:IclR family transcriptional regulator [Nocardia macrotermitis]MQY21615.1 hypothetical protein [Nocardia macrotermitis]
MARNSNGESAFSRTVRVLEAFGPRTPALTVSELSRRTGISMPTVSRLVSELIEHGWLVRDAERSVRVGVRMWELASRAAPAVELCRVAQPYAVELLGSVGHHVQISVRQGRDMVVVERLSALDAVHSNGRYADRLPLLASAPGLVLLAHTSPEFQESLLTEDPSGRSATDPALLRRRLNEIRSTGCAYCPGMPDPDVTVIAVPLRAPGGRVMAALSVAVPNGERARGALAAVSRTGARISQAYAERNHANATAPAHRHSGEGRRTVSHNRPVPVPHTRRSTGPIG